MTKTRSFLCQDKSERFLINSPFSDRKGDAGALRGGERPHEGVVSNGVRTRGDASPHPFYRVF